MNDVNILKNLVTIIRTKRIIFVIVEPKNANMKGFKSNIEKGTLKNTNFRKVLYTSKHLQVVLMSLKPGEEIGAEIHKTIDQFFRFEGGKGKCIIDGNEYKVENGDAIVVPAGSKHNVINTDAAKELKMYTIYAPPNHKDGLINGTKKDAEKNDVKFDGKTTWHLPNTKRKEILKKARNLQVVTLILKNCAL